MNRNIFYPKIRIHTWGGLGSQLYAVALAIEIKRIFPHRNIKFICHTSGVTQREPEIQFFSKTIHTKNDFNDGFLNSSVVKRNNRQIVKNLLIKILNSTGIMQRCNNNKEFSKLKPWIVIIRGHYTGVDISSHTALEILKKIDDVFVRNKQFDSDSLSLHYRLGDLISLKEKNPINSKLLSEIILKANKTYKSNKVYIYSDSIKVAQSELSKFFIEAEIILRQVSALETVHECVKSSIFIGTNSKISIWIAILRAASPNTKKSYLPTDLKHMINHNHLFSYITNSIIYY